MVIASTNVAWAQQASGEKAQATAGQTGSLLDRAQSSSPSTNVPSSVNSQSTKTPGGSSEIPTSDVGGAAAQTNPTEPLAPAAQDIVVTGFRASITNAINTKRNADQILESISSEDIGKLPDNSIAESIARLPGVTAQRVDGRDQEISIRGFAPDFSTTLLNGREQVTTNDNRSVEFDQYPSELLGQVVVYKTPSAGLVGQGLSGTIDLRTIRPLEYGKRVFAANARGELVTKGSLNAGSTNKGYRVSGIYVDQFANNTLGVTLGVAHMESPSQFERFNAWGYPQFDGNNATYGTPQPDGTYKTRPEYAAAQGKYVIGGAKPYVQSNKLTRTGVVGTIEWAPTTDLTTTIDGFYSKFKEAQALSGIEFPLAWGNAVLQPGYTVTGDRVTSGTWSNVKGVLRSDYIERDAEIFSGGINTKYKTGPLTLVGDASYSRVKRKDIYIESYAGTSRGVSAGGLSSNPNVGPFDTFGFQTQGNGITTFNNSQLNYADPNLIKLTSPQGWAAGARDKLVPGGQDGYYSSPDVKDELYALRGSASYEISSGNSVEIGGNYTSRTKRYLPTEYYLSAAANVSDPTHTTSVTVPSSYILGTTDLSYLGIPGIVRFNSKALVDAGILDLLPNGNSTTEANTWALHENVATGWLRYNFNAPVGAGSFTGNAGVQIVYTDQSSDGYRNVSGANDGGTITDGIKYTDILPSLNLSFRFDTRNVLRIGAARTLARARMDQLKSSFTFSVNPTGLNLTNPYQAYFSGSGGNARLKPWIADGVDVSFEHYISRTGYFAVAGYYRYLESYIYDSSTVHDFTGTPTGSVTPATFLGIINQPVNGTGGVLYGAEISGTIPLGDFTHLLDGFGVIGSYSYTKSNIVANPDAPMQPLPGLSKHVANGTLFFEKAGFSTRGSIRYRSGFLAEVISLGPGATNRQARGETIVDAQIGYEFQKGPLKGLGILIQGQNLTSEPFVTEDVASHLIIDYQDYGRRFLGGIAYKF